MQYKKYEFDTYNVYTIKTDKFKNCHMEITFYDNAKKEDLGLRSFLVDMLCHSSKNYPKRKEIVIKLEELYQSFFYGVSSKVGNMVLSTFSYDFINPKFVSDKNFLENVLKFPFEIIENPNVCNDAFDERSFQIVKKRILSDIDSIKENPTNFAFHRALENMDKTSITAASVLGTKDDILKITPESLYEYYHKFYNNSLCNIYIIGNLEMDEVVRIINESFHNNCVKNHSLIPFVANKVRRKELVVKEASTYSQTNLIMGYNLVNLSEEELFVTLNLFNEILCAGGLNSKICKSLREDNQLCYSVSSIISKYDNLYYIYVSLEEENAKLAIKLIKAAISDMASGKISDEEFNTFKKQLLNSLNIVLDNQSSLINNYTFNSIVSSPLYKDLPEKLEKITIDDLKDLGKKLKLNFIYILKGKEKARCKKSN
jgi:predicted Zn-dependent peptidase